MRTLGNSGLKTSVVGLGCNNFGRRVDAEQTRAVVDAALETGVTLFDTADGYSGGASEELLGRALGKRRDQAVIATKFGHNSYDMGYGPAAGAKGGRAYVRRAVEGSLRRLGTDYIDLYQLHTPDPATPIEETLAALNELVREGKVRYIGHSNFSGWQLAKAAHLARELGCVPFVSAQNHWSMVDRYAEVEVTEAAVEYGLGVLPYFPLAQGLLTGKVKRGQAPPAESRLAGRVGYITEDRLTRAEALAAAAEKFGRSLLDVAIGALAAQPGCASVIAGATSPQQVRANVAAGQWVPDAEQLAALDQASPIVFPQGHPEHTVGPLRT